MIIKQVTRIFGLLALTVLVGCAAGSENLLWSSASEDDLRQDDYQSERIAISEDGTASTGPSYTTSQVSAAAGAALGAGIGAVVGSATGNAGEGLAIGAVAGAASGALVGNEFQKRDEVIQQQREILARQEEVIKAQGGNIEEIRRSLEDRFPTNKPSANPRTSLDRYKGNPAAKPFAASSTSRARLDSTTFVAPTTPSSYKKTATSYGTATEIAPAKKITSDSGLGTPAVSSTKAPEKVATIAPAKPIAPIAAPVAVAPAAPKQEVAKVIPTPVSSVAEVKKEPVAGAIQPSSDPVELASVKTEKKETASTVAKMTSAETTGCKEAVEEARRAEEAVSEADKLFYYRRAARLCPVEASYRVKIGQVYATLGKKDQAKGEFEKALEIDSENVIANEELSLIESNIAN